MMYKMKLIQFIYVFLCLQFSFFVSSFRLHNTHLKNKFHFHSNKNYNVKTYNRIDSNTIDSPSTLNDDDFYIDEDALIFRINAEIMEAEGVQLEDLINPSKVVNLERDLLKLNNQLTKTTDATEIEKLQSQITKSTVKLNAEKRAVMRGWLKNLFVGQSILAGGLSLCMVYNVIPGYDLPLSIKVLGFWMWWLFIIPSLRARKPSSLEKEALNIAFLATPLVSIAIPVITKDVVLIWWANAITTLLCYIYAFNFKKEETLEDSIESDEGKNGLSSIFIKAFKALDYGSGQERGARK